MNNSSMSPSINLDIRPSADLDINTSTLSPRPELEEKLLLQEQNQSRT